MAPGPPLTPPRRAVAAALLWLLAGALAGVAPLAAGGVEYRTFGLTEAIFALLVVYALLERGAWRRTPGPLGWAAVAYGAWATAQLLELLFPPPGLLEWVVVTALALTAWSALGGGTRERLIASLASLALLLALLNFSVVPILWERAGPAPGEAFGFGDLAESARQLVAAYRPMRREGQLLGALAIALWAAGTRLLWDVAATSLSLTRTEEA